MSKKEEKFRDIWVNQGTLGKTFNLSAIAIGNLKALWLKNPGLYIIATGQIWIISKTCTILKKDGR